MQVFNIDKNLLKAAAYAAATDDPRPINGVYLDKDAGKIKATDGYMYCTIDCEDIKKIPQSIIIPTDWIKYAIKKTDKDFPFVSIFFEDGEFSILSFKQKLFKTNFPDDKSVTNINHEDLKQVDIKNESLKLNIRYIKKLGKIQKALGLHLPMFFPVYLSSQINETEFKAFKFEFLNCQVYIMPLKTDTDYK
nr:MAG TPA: beta clamp protein [Caudoviricetes sp.]